MSIQASACCARVIINFPPTTGDQALCLSPPDVRRQGKFNVHVLPRNGLLVERKSVCWNCRAESAGAWTVGRLPESVAVAYSGNGHVMMPGALPIVPKPIAALRPCPTSNNFLGKRDQRHGQRLLERACTDSYGTHPPSTPQDVEDKGPNYSEIHDTSSDNIISESGTTGLESGITLAGDSPPGGFTPKDPDPKGLVDPPSGESPSGGWTPIDPKFGGPSGGWTPIDPKFGGPSGGWTPIDPKFEGPSGGWSPKDPPAGTKSDFTPGDPSGSDSTCLDGQVVLQALRPGTGSVPKDPKPAP